MREDQICAMVKDLLPLYEENALSDESMEAVREHLLGCESCSREYDLDTSKNVFDKGIEDAIEEPDQKEYGKIAKKIKKIRVRRTFEIIGAVLAVVIVFSMMFDTKQFSDMSMEPAIKPQDVCLVSNISYLLSDPKRGDIVEFDGTKIGGYHYMKRIVAAPGDTVAFKNNSLYVNGKKDTRYSSIQTDTVAKNQIRLGTDEYFVIGDNVEISLDSRYEQFGLVSKKDIVGKYICTLPFGNPFVSVTGSTVESSN